MFQLFYFWRISLLGIKFVIFLQILLFDVLVFLLRSLLSIISIEILEMGVHSNYQRKVNSNCQRGVHSPLLVCIILVQSGGRAATSG